MQNHYSLLTRDPETNGVFDTCRRLGMVFVPYFPLESGLLTGKYRRGEERPEGSRLAAWGDRAERVHRRRQAGDRGAVAAPGPESRGHTLLDLALSWHTSNPLVASVIAGATTPDQVAANVAAAGWALTQADRADIDTLLTP